MRSSRDETLRKYFLISQNGLRTPDGPPLISERVSRRLLQPRAKQLNRLQSVLVMPGQGSPADVIRRDPGLLKSAQVLISPCAAPIPELYTLEIRRSMLVCLDHHRISCTLRCPSEACIIQRTMSMILGGSVLATMFRKGSFHRIHGRPSEFFAICLHARACSRLLCDTVQFTGSTPHI